MAGVKDSALYSISDLHFSYTLGKTHVEALRGVSIAIERADMVCFVGPSGSGKTTLLNVLGMIEQVQLGEVLMDGQSLANLNEPEKNRLRKNKIGFIFQTFQLFPVLTAFENVEFFLARQKVPPGERKSRVEEALEAVGLWDFRHQKPLEMSGGQKQRVAIARAIAKNPQVILADEPTASLDQNTGREVMEILSRLNQKQRVTVILSSHDPMIQQFARTMVQLRDGRIVDGGRHAH